MTSRILNIILIAVIIAIILLWKFCTPAPVVTNYKAELDSVQVKYKRDSAANKWKIDSLQAESEFKDMEKELLSDELTRSGKRIIRIKDYDTLLREVPVYVTKVDSFVRVVAQADSLIAQERLAWAERDSLTNIAYLSAVDVATRAIEGARQRASVLVGITGGGNLTQRTAGPSLMFRPASGNWQLSASYEIGNTQPMYRVGYYRTIRLRR